LIHYDIPYLETLADAWLYLVTVALLGLGTLILLWKNHPAGFLGAFVLAILSPTFVIPAVTEVAAERRMYLPLVAIAALVVVGGYGLVQSLLRRGQNYRLDVSSRSWGPLVSVVAPASCVAIVMALVSSRRLAAYDNAMTLWQEVLRLQPHSHVAHENVGVEYYHLGDYPAALRHYRESIRLKPGLSLSHYNLALVLSKLGQNEEAVDHFRQAAKYRPGSPELLNNLGVSLFVVGRNEEAISTLQDAIKLKPTLWRAHDNLGKALSRAGRLPEAIEAFKRSLKHNPEALDVLAHLADAQAKANQPTQAIATAERALKLARAAGAHATATKIDVQLADYRASLEKADESATSPSFGRAVPSN
jgi:tetratricopeptide (TPR) repeat protein